MITIGYEPPIEPQEALTALVTMAVEATLRQQGSQGDVSLSIVDDAYIQALNKDYRNIDAPTDVLSFSNDEGEAILAPPDRFLGDIVLSLTRAKDQARQYGHSLGRELAFLATHGALHLLGYDHQSEAEAKKMFRLQESILATIGATRE
jgi:probable rRNA maturation factor